MEQGKEQTVANKVAQVVKLIDLVHY